MEHSLSSLAFKGSIVEAITEAKQEKKLFVVYLAGDNPDSKHLETSTWTDPSVSETIIKYCILLHILEGSSEASQFSAIYPQNSAPSITAIGYHGVRLWQTEGIVAAEVLVSSLEKAWLSLHVQETTAALLTAALASEQNRTSHTSENLSSEQDTPSANESSSSSSRLHHISSLNVGQLDSETTEERNSPEEYKEADSKQNYEVSLNAPNASLEIGGLNESTSQTVVQNTSLDPKNSEKTDSVPGENSELYDRDSGQINDPPNNVAKEAIQVVKTKTPEIKEDEKAHTSDSPAVISNDVILNIKMPDGSSLQVKFTVMDTLRMVKDYISENFKSEIGSFDLAIPDPSKVFNEQELVGTLSSLGLLDRRALVVVPRKQTHNNVAKEASEVVKTETSDTKVEKAQTPAVISNDVFLNIKMPDGSSLQVRFTVMDTLRMVKDYVSGNSTSNVGSFDLAIPYPHKVFNEQELKKTLSSLGLFNRQALVVIPSKQAYSRYRYGSGSSSSSPTYSSSKEEAGYWASVRRILSYANPFSYFTGGATSTDPAQGYQSRTWQFSPNPSLGNNLRGAGTTSTDPSSDQNGTPANASGNRRKTSGFGANIHTLKRDEDDERFKDRNAFWNGNSTEYGGGGDNDGR